MHFRVKATAAVPLPSPHIQCLKLSLTNAHMHFLVVERVMRLLLRQGNQPPNLSLTNAHVHCRVKVIAWALHRLLHIQFLKPSPRNGHKHFLEGVKKLVDFQSWRILVEGCYPKRGRAYYILV